MLAALVLAAFSFLSYVLLARLQPSSRPDVLEGYGRWVRGIPTGATFHALLHGRAGPPVLTALGHSAVLIGGAALLVVPLSILLASAAARRSGRPADLVLRGVSYLAWGIPAFLLAFLVSLAVTSLGGSHGLGPFPIAGWPGFCPAGIGVDSGTISPCPAAGTGLRYVLNVVRYVTLPVLTLAVGFIALHGRHLRASLVETLDAPFVTTARAKGLSERQVVRRHARRVVLPAFTAGLLADFGAVFGAALAVDYVFQLGGLGTLFVHEFNPNNGTFDLDSLMTLVLVTAGLVLLSSFAGELAVDRLDPRVRGRR